MPLEEAEELRPQRFSSLLKLLLIVLLDQRVTLSHCGHVVGSIWVIEDMVFDTTIVLFDIHLNGAWDCWGVAIIETGYELFCHSYALVDQSSEVVFFSLNLSYRLVNQLIGSGIDREAGSFERTVDDVFQIEIQFRRFVWQHRFVLRIFLVADFGFSFSLPSLSNIP